MNPRRWPAPAVAAAPAPAPVVIAAVAPVPPPASVQPNDSGKAVAEPPRADTGDTRAGIDAIAAVIPVPVATGSHAVAALADSEEVVPAVHLGARLNVRLPRARGLPRRPLGREDRYATPSAVRTGTSHRSYAFRGGAPNPFGQPGIRYR